MADIPYGFCHCGCGNKTTISGSTSRREQRIKGLPHKYLRGHNFRRPLEERFWEKVDRRGPDECWLWTAATNYGYGKTSEYRNGKKFAFLAHRVSYEIEHGVKLNPDELVLHSCDNPPCVNPAHLYKGTYRDNTQDMINKGRDGHGVTLGSASKNAVLSESDIKEIRILLLTTPQAKIGELYNVTKTTIGRISRRESWKHVP